MSTTSPIGAWALEVNAPIFGRQKLTLTLAPGGDAPRGAIAHKLGSVELSEIQIEGANFNARAALNVRGTRYTATVSGEVSDDGETMNGEIKADIPFAPAAKFKGKREQKS
jgi:hypothetical protein